MSTATFDSFAADYDAEFTDTPLGRVLREMVWARTDALFQAPQQILELGCGTGEDAVHFATRGIRVVATDASNAMVEAARRKAQGRGVEAQIDLRCMPMEHVPGALGLTGFDGVFSNFGAVNCVKDLRGLAGSVARMLKPGAPLVWVVMGRYVPWEWLWYSARLQGSKAWRRLRRGGVEWRGLTIVYPTPRQLARLLAPHFAVTRVTGLGVVLPPTYAAGWLNRSRRTLATLTWLERRVQRSRALAACADHYILEARRLSQPGPLLGCE